MNEPLLVRRETHIAAPPATVFAFLTDPEKIVSWMGGEATTETHPGGLYLLKGIGGDHARPCAAAAAARCSGRGSRIAAVARAASANTAKARITRFFIPIPPASRRPAHLSAMGRRPG